MSKQFILGLLIGVILISAFASGLNIQLIRATPTTIVVPDDYTTIQEAINNAAEGDMVFVRAGTYYEHVIVGKSLTLLGEDREVTIIDGNMIGNVIQITHDHVNIRGFTIQRSGRAYRNSGIYIGSARHCDISANCIVDNEFGVCGFPRNMSITDNIIEGNFLGVALESGATSNVISRNHLVANYVSVHLNLADANYILQNNMTNNWRSVTLWESKNNKVYHNNFLNNTFGSVTAADPNFLDNGFEGNYWSNYTGVDLNHDGIGDSPYVIDANHTDHYPLMGMFSSFNTSYGYAVDFVSNSSVLNANFNPSPIGVFPPEAILTFNISGETGTGGFLRVCIPKILINGAYVVRFNDEVITNTTYPRVRELPCSNETYTYFYINYTHSEHTITITGTSACAHRFVVVPDDYATIQEAINHAIDRDVIYVKSGVYCEHVVVNKTVTLIGEDVSTTIIDGNNTGHVISVIRDNVNITGFTVQRSGNTQWPALDAGICLNSTTNCAISENRLIYNGFAAISLLYSDQNAVIHNNLSSTGWGGIHLMNSSRNTVSGNIITDKYGGVNGHVSSNYNNIMENVISNCTHGGFFHASSYNNISGNNISDIAVEGIWLQDQVNYNVVAENTLNNNTVAIRLQGPNYYNTLLRNVITDAEYGIKIEEQADSNTVSGNTITGCQFGIQVLNARYTEIYNNTIVHNYGSGWDAGIRLDFAGFSRIHSNLITDNWRGILLYTSSPRVSIYNNNVTDNEYAIRVASGGSSYVNVSGNYVANNHGYGIGLTGFGGSSNYATISGNIILNNSDGIALGQYSNYNTIIQNNINQNDNGISIEYSTQNTIWRNNITDNVQQVYVATYSVNTWDKGYLSGGNYWSDYSGVDANHDGIGDTPYIIDFNNRDRYPLMGPGPIHALMHTLAIDGSPTGVTFMVDGVSHTAPWSGTYYEGTLVNLEVPEMHSVGEARYYWSQWSDGVTNRSRTVTMNTNITLTALFTGSYHLLNVTSSPMTELTFTIDGVPEATPFVEWLLEGSYTLEMPETGNGYVWYHWLEDGDTNRTKTIMLSSGNTTWTGVFAILGDLNHDGEVDMKDLVQIIMAFGSHPSHPSWNPDADINNDNKVDMRDIVIAILNFGERL